jgi:hypothetical protein
MAKAAIAIIALMVGIALGAYGALSLGTGAAMGVGVATGMSAGICSVVEAAEKGGFLTAEQIDALLARAREGLTDQPLPEGASIAGSTVECAAVMQKLRSAG